MAFNKEHYERYGGLRRSEIAFWEKYQAELDYMKSFLFCPCGSVEGLHLLHSLGKRVLGVEFNKDIVQRCPFPNLIKQGDVRSLSKVINDTSFECVISFDLLEHLQPKDIIKAVQEFTQIASICVVIGFCSTDFKWFYNDPSHITWWSYNTWKEVLSSVAKVNNFELVRENKEEELFIFKYFDR